MKKFVAAFLCFFAFSAYAITNIESQRLKPIPEGLSGQFEFAFDGKSGNTDEEDYGLAGRINVKREQNLWFVIATKEYGEANDVKDTDKSFLHGRWVHTLDNALAAEAFVQYQENEFTRLLSRYLAGGGMRYTIKQDAKQQLAAGAGAFYVNEREDLETYEAESDYLRLNSYISYKQELNSHVSLVSTAYYQPRASDFGDYNILWNTALSAKLSEQLALKLSFNATHDSEPPSNNEAEPPVDVDKTDLEYSLSVVYDF